MCPKSTHTSPWLRPEPFLKLSTAKIRLGIDFGQCYERTTAGNRFGSSIPGELAGKRALSSAFRNETAIEFRPLRLLRRVDGTAVDSPKFSPLPHDEETRPRKSPQHQNRNIQGIVGCLAVRWCQYGFSRPRPEPRRRFYFRPGAVTESFLDSSAFSLPEGEIRVDGVVRYADAGKGMGVEFNRIDTGDHARLRELIRRLNA